MTLKFACRDGRAQLVVGPNNQLVDLEIASNGKFDSNPNNAFSRWAELREFAASVSPSGDAADPNTLDAPSPSPRQVFGIGLNYRSHAEEGGMPIPTSPLTFTKFPTSVAGPNADIPIVGNAIDWEVELVVVISTGGRDIQKESAWSHVAGLCVGQDISDRALQFATQPPQFNLGKSRKNYSPFGPWLVDAADVANRDALPMHMTLNGQEMQRTVTDDLIFSVSDIVSYLSNIVELLPGDVIFTGTPAGVGGSRQPQVFLKPGDVIVSTIEGIGTTTNKCV